MKLLLSREKVTGVEFDSILVIIDRLTKYTYILLYKEASIVEDLTYTFLRTVISNYRLLEEIISDKDKLFTSKF